MISEPQAETAEYLMARVTEADLSASAAQVARWHRVGLLPQPRQQSLGRGRGTQTVYPPGTARQLIALIQLHRRYRYLDDVGWRLWWHGFSVSEPHWLGHLRHAASRFDDIRAKARQALALLEDDDDQVADAVLANLETAAVDSSVPKFVKHLRKRVGRRNFASLLRFLMMVVDGSFGSPPDATDDPDKEQDLIIVARATGFGQSQRRPPKGYLPLLIDPKAIWESFGIVSSVLREATLVSRVEHVRESAWIEARDELRDMMTFFQIFIEVLRPIFGRRLPYGLGVAAEIADQATTFDLALMLIVYRALKDDAFHCDEANLIESARGSLAAYAAWRSRHAT
ncbi:MAG: hypothetical protein KGJ41_17815 [Rhodospirillales bacterium]|nr:hypothetical protein [Rhodospirillales bacterium]